MTPAARGSPNSHSQDGDTYSLNVPYNTVEPGLPELPQPGTEVASSPNDLYNLYDQDLARSSLKSLS